MRIIGGRFKGHSLKAPTDHTIRPTSDRLRETLFNILAHAYDNPTEEARVLDLFAGTGALGLEALSRGARFAQFVDDSAQGRGLLRANIESLGVAAQTKVFRRDATRMGHVHPHDPFSLVFCDPPYNKGLGDKALTSAYEGGWFAPKALIVLEESSKAELDLPAALTRLETRDFGETQVIFLQAPDV
jgi:16S rRNA (guanine966-N2)-methyltransferase